MSSGAFDTSKFLLPAVTQNQLAGPSTQTIRKRARQLQGAGSTKSISEIEAELKGAAAQKMAEIQKARAALQRLEQASDTEIRQIIAARQREAEHRALVRLGVKRLTAEGADSWAKMGHWRTTDNVASLLHGYDPTSTAKLNSATNPGPADGYKLTRALIRSNGKLLGARLVKNAGYAFFDPSRVIHWARKVDISVPDYLLEAVEKYQGKLASLNNLEADNASLPKEKEFLNRRVASVPVSNKRLDTTELENEILHGIQNQKYASAHAGARALAPTRWQMLGSASEDAFIDMLGRRVNKRLKEA
jgi:hypothetical protein